MGRHRKYIQIIGHRKYKLIPVIILGLVGMSLIVFYLWHLKAQYDISPVESNSNNQIDNTNGSAIDVFQEDFVKGASDKK